VKLIVLLIIVIILCGFCTHHLRFKQNMDVDDRIRIEELYKENEELKNDITLIETEKLEFEMDYKHMESVAKNHRLEISRLKLSLKKEKEKRRKVDDKYNELLDEMKLSPYELERELVKYKEDIEQMSEDYRNQEEQLRATNQVLSEENHELRENMRRLRIEQEEFGDELEEERRKCKRLEKEKDDLYYEKQNIEKELCDLQLRTSELSTERANTNTELSNIRNKNNRLKKELKRERRKSQAKLYDDDLRKKFDFGGDAGDSGSRYSDEEKRRDDRHTRGGSRERDNRRETPGRDPYDYKR